MGTAEATYAQHAVWFTEQAGAAGTAYHMALGVWFAADLDRSALAAACDAVVARHPILTTRIADDDGMPRLAPAAHPPTLVVGDLTDDRIAAEIARGHELRTGPLARFQLLAGADGRQLLLVTAHHLVFDGMSKDVLVRDLATAYAAARSGRPARLAPLPTDYQRHAAAERDRVAAETAAARAHWATHWTGPGGVVLPGLTRIPAAAEPGAVVPVALGPDLVAALDQARRKLEVTRFELVLAVVHLLLDRYGNRGTPVGVGLSTRTEQTTDQVGLFVNELPVTVTVTDGDFRDHAHAVRDQVRSLNRIRAVPLAHVVSGLRPAPALTPVSVGYRRRGPEPTFDQVATSVEWALFSGAARNALHIQIVDGPGHDAGPDTLELSLQHSPAAIATDAVARIGAQLRTMLLAVTADPDQPIAGLPVLPAEELVQVCHGWNATGRDYPADATVVNLFADQVRRTPDAVAVVDGQRRLSYADLDRASARLAASLRGRGVGRGAVVAVALDRSWQAVAALLAVLRCRAAYVPVDPAYPPARRAMIIADAAPTLVLTASSATAALAASGAPPTTDVPTLALDQVDLTGPETDHAGPETDHAGPETDHAGPETDQAGLGTGSSAPATDLPTPDDPAYVLYTSGSTGRPKGVVVPHRALANLVLAMRDEFDAEPAHRWLNLTSLSFDISGVELYLPLTTGGRVVVAAGVSALDGAGVLRLVRDEGVTHVQATPSGWRVLLEAGLDDSVVAVTGGEALPVPLARDLRQRVRRLVNGYGPTEATIYATMADIPAEPDEVTIGRPVANTTAYLLDEARRPVPIGVPGELYLGGRGVADGYLGRPELTAQRFVDDPFTDGRAPGRLYRTGDLCRWTPDGRIEFLGRTDDQVKIRGHRVELGEITARLLEHPAVTQAAVLLHATDGGTDEPRLVGYLVPRGPAPAPAALRRHLAESLPTAMLPTDWVVLDRLPVSPNGKLDRAALPPPAPMGAPVAGHPAAEGAAGETADNAAGQAARPALAALTDADSSGADSSGADSSGDPVIEEIRLIWQDVLQIPEIGIHEDLFDLGGHSLTITRISSRIHRRLGVEVPLDAFFDTPTIAEIADVVRQERAGH
ncbi:amino acid adenylation domain-containing protein [Solwaraspora sp. WMMD406]|uniref:non-ribosomal peptide synthetase n=1 Tax=Solwaraspora sp. WMMD406 TaxID=3016095 RepID=UPI002416C32E|nr:amino acid adenylation domain-containing protein [Solwaraspora sp. WMMD406]MDG4764528.1 amino acid adenylation domain-containing protein [Solwaraspora sp. WMMD406]